MQDWIKERKKEEERKKVLTLVSLSQVLKCKKQKRKRMSRSRPRLAMCPKRRGEGGKYKVGKCPSYQVYGFLCWMLLGGSVGNSIRMAHSWYKEDDFKILPEQNPEGFYLIQAFKKVEKSRAHRV